MHHGHPCRREKPDGSQRQFGQQAPPRIASADVGEFMGQYLEALVGVVVPGKIGGQQHVAVQPPEHGRPGRVLAKSGEVVCGQMAGQAPDCALSQKCDGSPPSRRARSFQCDAFKRARIVFCDLDLPRCWALAFFDPGHA